MTSTAYPPSTGYQRPTERRFYIWQDRHINYSGYGAYQRGEWGLHPWRWLCTFCDPPAAGFRARTDAYQSILKHMPKHFERRQDHHRWAARKPAER